jgi:hypothetical protein
MGLPFGLLTVTFIERVTVLIFSPYYEKFHTYLLAVIEPLLPSYLGCQYSLWEHCWQ